MPVRLLAVCSCHAQKARSEYGKPDGDNKVDHDFFLGVKLGEERVYGVL